MKKFGFSKISSGLIIVSALLIGLLSRPAAQSSAEPSDTVQPSLVSGEIPFTEGGGLVSDPPTTGGNSDSLVTDPPIDEPKTCVWVAAWAIFSTPEENDTDGKANDLVELQDALNNVEPEALPACFAAEWEKRCFPGGLALTEKETANPDAFKRYLGCMGTTKSPENPNPGNDFAVAKDLAEFLEVPESLRVGMPTFGGILRGEEFDPAVTFYMNSDCKFTPLSTSTKVCGFTGISWSPISLLWGSDETLDERMTVVKFSLDARYPSHYSLWKGSEVAPLLVFDPSKTGTVSGAAQLFGNYTFGGRTAELSKISLDSISGKQWANGYEALGLLDFDKDGKVSGQELSTLSLWFDRNRDAQVDSGELVTLESSGIVALYYKDPKSSKNSKDLKLEIGYERMVDGKLEKGASVDWYAETFSSKNEALQALQSMTALASKKENESQPTSAISEKWQKEPLKFKPHPVSQHEADLSGFWRWHLLDDKGVAHPGAFAIEEMGGGKLRGFSVVETKLKNNPQHLRSAVVILPLEGQITKAVKGIRELSFTVTDPSSGTKAKSTAKVKEDGVVLLGKTEQTFELANAGRESKKSAVMNYDWVAQKFISEE